MPGTSTPVANRNESEAARALRRTGVAQPARKGARGLSGWQWSPAYQNALAALNGGAVRDMRIVPGASVILAVGQPPAADTR